MLGARDYELRLLRCGMMRSGSEDEDEDDALAAAIESGNYREALRAALKEAVGDGDDYDYGDDELLARIDSFLASSSHHNNIHVVMCAAVAAFLAFIHSNITGPPPLPQNPLPFSHWAAHHLISSSGSDLLANFSHLQYLVLAKTLLFKVRDTAQAAFPTVSWWLARVILVQQRLLDHRSSSLFDLLQLLTRESLRHFGTLDVLTAYWGPTTLRRDEALAILSLLHLEAGIMEYTFGRVDPCRSHFEAAEAAAGLELSITGVLGFRTIHQVEPKAQMVLVVANNRNLSDSDGRNSHSDPDKHDSNGYVQTSHPRVRLCPSEESDILITPKLVEEDSRGRGTEEGKEGIRVGNKTAAIPLSAIQQAVILAKCLLIEKTSPHDDTQRWDMAPYIEAIDSQHSSCFTIRSFCDLLRIRWESNRSHTKERSLLMMEKLVQGMYDPSPGVQHRILFCHAVCIPPLALLRKEYGELLVRCGLIGEAAKIFEDLEMWDNLILCYRLMEKKAAAVKLINARLSVIPDDPRLWCSLGDVTNDDTCYEKALQLSNNRSARAKRSLARSAYDRGDYEASKALWESAMAMNSLYPDGWFALGAAALKAKDVDKAIDGFTRAVQLDPDNGEAWNNIACLHMMRKKNKESFIAFKEALKFKRNSWQLWENFGQVALQVRNISQALEAVRMVLELSSNKRVDTELLASIMTELETRVSNDTNHESCIAESRETEHLVDFLGKVIQLAIRSCKGGDLWGVYARWHRLKGDLTMCSEALLKQVRSYQGSDLWQDRELFRRFARASLELCNVYMEISSSNRRELFTAEMHLKSAIKQAAEAAFSDMEEVDHLQACLEQVQTKLQSS